MTLENVKSKLLHFTAHATPLADAFGTVKLGNSYTYLARPVLTAIHGYFSNKDTITTIAYKALAYPFGMAVTKHGPIPKAIELQTKLIETPTKYVTGKIFSSPLPGAALSAVASSYAKFRITLYLRKMIPFLIGSFAGADIYRLPRTEPRGIETFVWILEALSLIAGIFATSIIATNPIPPAEKLKVLRENAVQAGDTELTKALTDLIEKPDETSLNALKELVQKRKELAASTEIQPSEAPAEKTSKDAKKARLLEIANNLRELREERQASTA